MVQKTILAKRLGTLIEGADQALIKDQGLRQISKTTYSQKTGLSRFKPLPIQNTESLLYLVV